MIIEELHKELERKWYLNGNNYRPGLTDLQKDQVLNESIFDYVEYFRHGRNPKELNFGLEFDQQRTDMLDTLIRSFPQEPLLSASGINTSENEYTFDFRDLTIPYKSYISSRLSTNCGDVKVRIEQHGDMNTVLSDDHRKPNKSFKEVPAFLRNDTLHVYTGGLFTVNGLKLSYLKKPARVRLGTYGSVPTAQVPNPPLLPKTECDLPEDYHPLLLDIAVQNLDRIYRDTPGVQIQTDKIQRLT